MKQDTFLTVILLHVLYLKINFVLCDVSAVAEMDNSLQILD